MTNAIACNFLAEKLAARHLADLSPIERAELNAHIASCPACAAKKVDYDILTTRIRQLPAVVPLAATTSEFFWRGASSLQDTRARKTRAFSPLPIGTIAISAGTLVVATFLIVSLVLLQQTHSKTASQSGVASQNAMSTVSIVANSCLVPTVPGHSISCTASYIGTITDRENTISSPLQLTVRQQQGRLTGSGTLSFPTIPALPVRFTARLSGTIDDQGVVHFSIQPTAKVTISFTGSVHQREKTISGSYITNMGQAGTWKVHLMI